MHLYSLDLSENNVRCDSFEQLLPLARQLQAHADWVAMGGNDLPDYDKTTSTSSAALDELRGSGHFSLALLTDSPKGAHAEAWKETAEEFDIWSYGSPRRAEVKRTFKALEKKYPPEMIEACLSDYSKLSEEIRSIINGWEF